MEDKRKDWKRIGTITDCTPEAPLPSPPDSAKKVERAMTDISAALHLQPETEQQLRQALTTLFEEFHDAKADIYPEFYQLMDDVYATAGWALKDSQEAALAEMRAHRKHLECTPDE